MRSLHLVLVVDDSTATRYAVARGLDAEGYRTAQAKSGAQALTMGTQASAIVLDVHLPDVIGLEVCRLLRSQGYAAPILLMSAQRMSHADEVAARAAGADDYLIAPVDPTELALRLDQLLKRRP